MVAYCVRKSHAVAVVEDRAIGHSARQVPPPSAPLQVAIPGREQQRQRLSTTRYPFEGKSRRRVSGHGTDPRRFPHPVKAGLFLVVGAILASPMSTVLPWLSGTSMGVSAALCTSGTTTTGAAQQVNVTPSTTLDLTSVFNCEDGDFDVYWSGEVQLTGTIVIGSGTTVRIFGDGSSAEGNSSLSNDEVVENLTSGLALPLRLTSAAVGVAPPNITVFTDVAASFGPMFYVDHGNLILEDLIVRGGFTASADVEVDMIGDFSRSGGGVFAVNSTVSVTRCEFNDNYAQHLGGGIFANASTLQVVDSMFRYCKAGYVATIEDDYLDIAGAGGGISADFSDVLINGCLFEGGYAQKKGAGVSQGNGNMSVLGSVFYNNTAGGENRDSEDPTGEGADLAFSACDRSYDGLAACGVNDTVLVNSRVAKKGGSVAISNGDENSSVVEFHGCTIDNSSTGLAMKDDPQGEGGAFSVGDGVTLILSNCTVKNSYCGKKGGVLALSSGDDWETTPGAIVIMRNSTFFNNTANDDNGGVVNLEKFAILTVEGDGNLFERNTCGQDGGVVASTTNTVVIIEGGTFKENTCGENGGVIWSKGIVNIEGGVFIDNESPENGGVLYASEESQFTVAGGAFEENMSGDGAVAAVNEDGILQVEGGEFSGNVAHESGGAFYVIDGGGIQITGGTFSNNEADFGGFLYAKGEGETSCTGVSILNNKAVEGGAIYAVDGVTLDWACDIGNNSALAGPAIYARDETTVNLTGISLFGNAAARGSAVFIVNSVLETYQVKFINSSGSLELSAVQLDQASNYTGDHTSFIGFEGEAVIFSEGGLYLDDCDFSDSTASVLVYSDPDSIAVIRNAKLGEKIYLALAKDSSNAVELPSATSLTNADVECKYPEEGLEEGNQSTSSPVWPCSGSVCLNGDLGVYCQCYTPKLSSETERCVGGDAAALSLTQEGSPEEAFYPELLEGDILLSYESAAAAPSITAATMSSVSSGGGSRGSANDGPESGEGGVVWWVEASPSNTTVSNAESWQGLLNWTILPSTGLLFPGESVMLRVATRPSTYFDGTADVTFDVTGVGADGEDGTSSVSQESSTGRGSEAVSFEVAFYHCDSGTFWKRADSSKPGSDGYDGTCELCTEADMDGEIEGLDCSQPGATLESLPINAGYWRAKNTLTVSRACYNEDMECDVTTADWPSSRTYNAVLEYDTLVTTGSTPGAGVVLTDDTCNQPVFNKSARSTTSVSLHIQAACGGGSIIVTADDYCNEGYEGVVCSVCSSGYGRGAANQCHICSDSFKGGIFFMLSLAVLVALGVCALLAVYLVGGRGAVSSTVANTKQSVIQLQRRGADLLSRSERGGVSDFSQSSAGRSSGSKLNQLRREGKKSKSPGDDASVHQEPAGDGNTGDALSASSDGSTAGSQPVLSRAYGGPSLPIDSQEPNEPKDNAKRPDEDEQKEEGKTMAGKIGAFLSGLPLSKLKIVIVVWQISAAFADVTNVGFPPAYEKFLSLIGIFSLDLGWLLSATCVAAGVGFHAKLLIVTIGPMILLCLLGVTFHLGSRPARPRVETLDDLSGRATHGGKLGRRTSSITAEGTSVPTGSHIPDGQSGNPSVQGQPSGEGGVKSGTDKSPARRSGLASGVQNSWVIHMSGPQMANGPSPAPRGRVNGPFVTSERSLRSVWKAGPGDHSDPEQDHLWQLFARHTTMTLIILYLVYSQVSTVVFQTFACDEYDEIDEWRLRADGRIECNTATHKAYMVYAGIMVCVFSALYTITSLFLSQLTVAAELLGAMDVFARLNVYFCLQHQFMAWGEELFKWVAPDPFGIPAAFLYMLLRQRSILNPPTDKSLEESKGKQYVMQEKINQRANDESVAPTSFLWGAYYPSCYYFEVFECMRRLCLTGLLVFVPNTSGQVAYGCIFAFISLVAFEIQMPHIDGLEIQLYRTGCLVIFFTNFLALIIQTDLADENSGGSAVYSVLLILVHVFFVLSICWNSWATMKATFSRRHVQGVVLGVDLVDEENADKILGPEKSKEDKDKEPSKFSEETKAEYKEELPAWQDKAVVPEFNFDSSGSGSSSRRGKEKPDNQPGTSTNAPIPDA